MPWHIYKTRSIDLLKLNVMYGANGAGKSNLIAALRHLRTFVIKGKMPIGLINQTFKFDEGSREKDVYLGVEFVQDDIPYYYGITINQGIIVEEELQVSGLNKKEDLVLFRRTDSVDENNLKVEFAAEVQNDKEADLFVSFLENEILKRNQPILHYMKNRRSKVFQIYRNAFLWFERVLEIITPHSRPGGLPLQLELDPSFYQFVKNTMVTFNTGIRDILIEDIPVEEYFGADNKAEVDRVVAEVKASQRKMKSLRTRHEDVIFTLKDNKVVAKRIVFTHQQDNGAIKFSPSEESDGTRRLLDYLPALYRVIYHSRIYFVDEIERSIHPLLIKELIDKFSKDQHTKGQLIFSTHESNLLDQDIFRTDEIWFAEKSKIGATQLYPLSDFKEHHTIDIRKGYLSGRYGAIPFLGNLKDLNWDVYAEAN
jgi:hypothetical protein